MQLKDSWSVDAMSRYDKDSVDRRIQYEYRYHPDLWMRKYIKWMGMAMLPLTVVVVAMAYYVASDGGSITEGDSQFVLNVLRQSETSPRSKLYVYRDPALDELDASEKRQIAARQAAIAGPVAPLKK